MKVLVIGGGGREHALAWALKRSPRAPELFIAPGNPGTSALGTNWPDLAATDVDGLLRRATAAGIDLTVVGPEIPLVMGLADRFRAAGLKVFGPSAAAARLEGSKVFSKEFMARHGIPTAPFVVCADAAAAHAEVDRRTPPIVLKADGLAAGKGVTVAATREEAHAAVADAMERRLFGDSGSRVVIEDFLPGEEASLFVLTDGHRHHPFVAAQDYKRVFDGGAGPNTGGMGAYAPAGLVSPALLAEVTGKIVKPTLTGMAADGHPYEGLLYVGLMIGPEGPRVVEYNCRFGDPETQALMPLLDSDPVELLDSVAGGRLADAPLRWKPGSAVTLVMASGGYPGPFPKGLPIEGIAEAETTGAVVFHAGTTLSNGRLVTASGRVLNVTCQAPSLREAIEGAYRAAASIRFDGVHYRRDVGRGGLGADSRMR